MAKKYYCILGVAFFIIFRCNVITNPQAPSKTYFISGYIYKAISRNCMPIVCSPETLVIGYDTFFFPCPDPCAGPPPAFPLVVDSSVRIYETPVVNSGVPYRVVGTDSSGFYFFHTTQKTVSIMVDTSCKERDLIICDPTIDLCYCLLWSVDFDSLGTDSVELNDTLPALDYW